MAFSSSRARLPGRAEDDTVVAVEKAVAGVAGAENGEGPRWLEALDAVSLTMS